MSSPHRALRTVLSTQKTFCGHLVLLLYCSHYYYFYGCGRFFYFGCREVTAEHETGEVNIRSCSGKLQTPQTIKYFWRG